MPTDVMTRAAGLPDLRESGAKPDKVSRQILRGFWPRSVSGATMNSKYSDEIKGPGQVIKIRVAETGEVRDLVIGGNTIYDKARNGLVEVPIDQGCYIAVEENDLEKAQTDINVGDEMFSETALKMALRIDRRNLAYVCSMADPINVGKNAGLSGCYNMGTKADPIILEGANVMSLFNRAEGVLKERVYDDPGPFSTVIPQWVWQLFNDSELKNASISGLPKSVALEKNGYSGDINCFGRFVTPAVKQDEDDPTIFYIPFYHKQAVAFGVQVLKEYRIRDKEQPEVEFRSRKSIWGCMVVRPELVTVGVVKMKSGAFG